HGAAKFAATDLKVLQLALFQVDGIGVDAGRNYNEALASTAGNAPSALPKPISLHLGTSEALSNAAQTRIQLARAKVRPVLESSTSSHSEKALAHAYVAQEIQGAISMQRQAIQMEQLQAAADLSNALLGAFEALAEVKRREKQGELALHRY